MKLEEVVEIQERALADKWYPWSEELKASIKLGIEYTKEVKRLRSNRASRVQTRLPGETKN